MGDKLSRDEALALAKRCFKTDSFTQSRHFREQLVGERDLTIQDVIYIGQHGGVYNEAEFDIKHGEWNYRIEGTSPDGVLVGLVFSCKADGLILLITVFTIK